jgi:hypothetical protein
MTAIRSERLAADRVGPDKFGQEKQEKFVAERVSDYAPGADEAVATAFEGEIRDFIRRDVAQLRRPRQELEAATAGGDPAAENLNSLIRRVAGASMEEIDRVILELQAVRDMLRNEGDRVSREISGYASLSHAATTSMKVIADSLTQWRSGPTNFPRKIS